MKKNHNFLCTVLFLNKINSSGHVRKCNFFIVNSNKVLQWFGSYERERERERERAYMLTTWQPVVLGILQLQLTASFFRSLAHVDGDGALHGSSLKFQSFFPKVFAMSRKACSVKRYHHQKKKKKKKTYK